MYHTIWTLQWEPHLDKICQIKSKLVYSTMHTFSAYWEQENANMLPHEMGPETMWLCKWGIKLGISSWTTKINVGTRSPKCSKGHLENQNLSKSSDLYIIENI
jgi:hypothetical protein